MSLNTGNLPYLSLVGIYYIFRSLSSTFAIIKILFGLFAFPPQWLSYLKLHCLQRAVKCMPHLLPNLLTRLSQEIFHRVPDENVYALKGTVSRELW